MQVRALLLQSEVLVQVQDLRKVRVQLPADSVRVQDARRRRPREAGQ